MDIVEAGDSHLGQCVSPWVHFSWKAFESCAGNRSHRKLRDNRAEVPPPPPPALVRGGLTHLI